MKDSLGDRIKEQYESRTRYFLPRRTYTILRVDGKAFHTLTRNMQRPYDIKFSACMAMAAIKLCEELQGVDFAYVQSDEISILLTDFDSISTEAWFNGNLQKICSVSASIATAAFNQALMDLEIRLPSGVNYGLFDSRVFTIPDEIEVYNYFVWRQKDAARNSLSMAAQSLFSHKELQGKGRSQLNEMLFSKGINYDAYSIPQKRGVVVRQMLTGEENRWGWDIDAEIPLFTQEPNYLRDLIPSLPRWEEQIFPASPSSPDTAAVDPSPK